MIILLVQFFLPILFCLFGIGFYVMFERKVLGYIGLRKGPNKVGYMGIMQPFSDAGKLFCKEVVVPTYSNNLFFMLCPVLSLVLSLLFWVLYPFKSSEMVIVWGVLYYLAVSSASVYAVMGGGWCSNSKYALLGAIRAVAQTISYEVSMSLVLVMVVFLAGTFVLQEIVFSQEVFFFAIVLWPLLPVWFVCILAETNRAPFDFVEGESELVSGFNVEYGGGGFALIFMGEYSSMMFNSILSCALFWGGPSFLLVLFSMSVVFFFVWVRGTLPRIRYDMLMSLAWKSFLCISLSFLLLLVCLLSV